MGVPGLWRLLDMAAQPISLADYAGLKIAIDIHAHLNRILHSQNAANWVFLIMRDLFRVQHFNIKIVVVTMGRKPPQKIYSADLSDASDITYDKVFSGLVRASTRTTQKTEDKPARTTADLTEVVFAPPQRAPRAPELADARIDPANFALFQFKRRAERKGGTFNVTLDEHPEAEDELESQLLQDAATEDLLGREYSSSTGSVVNPSKNTDDESLCPVSLLPADNPYLKPTENWVTIDHVRILRELCALMGVELVQAPEEAVAECARLEMDHVVDAVASDDNNAFLFGSRWLIRGIFTNPLSVTLNSLEDFGITRERMLMLAMMIDGDYNANIRRRLFTVGPVRGLEIIAHFPDERAGLFQFKEWWARVVKGKQEENDPRRKVLARKQWIKRLVMPADFPPEDLLEALTNPVVGTVQVDVKRARIKDPEALVKYVCSVSHKPEARVREFVTDFLKHALNYNEDKRAIMKHAKNPVVVPEKFADHLKFIGDYDKAFRAANPKEALKRDIAKALAEDIDIPSELERGEEEEDSFEDVA